MRKLTPINAPGITSKVVLVSDLLDAGVKPWRLGSSDLGVPLWGTRSTPQLDASAFETRIAALRLVLAEGQFISRRSAAQCWGIPVPRPAQLPGDLIEMESRQQSKSGQGHGGWVAGRRTRPSVQRHPLDLIEVGAIRPRRPPMRAGLSWHQLSSGVLAACPTAPHWLPRPEDVWALLGAVCTVEDLIVAGDHLISSTRRAPTVGCELASLAGATDRFRGCLGVEKLREALPQLRLGVASPAETQCRLLIVRAGLPEPQTNCPVPTPRRVLHADLGYPQWRIAIEYDGAYHFQGGAGQQKFDNDRLERMRDAGWCVLRVTSLDLENPDEFLARLARAIQRARLG